MLNYNFKPLGSVTEGFFCQPQVPVTMANLRPTFTTAQISRYFDHIGLPRKHYDALEPGAVPDLPLLHALHVHHLAAIPYENLSLHYSAHRTVSLDPQELYAKFIERGCNRGGYCMEGSLFFMHVLRGLGFDVYPTGVRIRLREDGVPAGPYIGLVHIALIITLPSGAKHVCDVAFGGDGPTTPLPLAEGHVTLNLGTQEVRYVYEPIPQVAARPHSGRQNFWFYQYRNSPAKEWNSFYYFAETEFLEQDFHVINYFTSLATTFQRLNVIVIKFLRSGEEDDGIQSMITGKLMLVNDTVKRNLGGKTEVVKVCRDEAERVDALNEWFGIGLSDEERRGIKGAVTELGVEAITAQ